MRSIPTKSPWRRISNRQAPSTPPDVAILAGFATQDPASLRAELGLAMSAEDVTFCQAYFRDEEKRDPSLTELRMLDTYWSDHCRHTTFLTKIDAVTFDEGTEPVQRAWQSYQEPAEASAARTSRSRSWTSPSSACAS